MGIKRKFSGPGVDIWIFPFDDLVVRPIIPHEMS